MTQQNYKTYEKYQVGLVDPSSLTSLQISITEELRRIQQILLLVPQYAPEVSYVEPVRPRPLQIVFADGDKWNPGSGEGLYIYSPVFDPATGDILSGNWEPLMGGNGGGNPNPGNIAAGSVSVNTNSFDELTGNNLQNVLKQIDGVIVQTIQLGSIVADLEARVTALENTP